MDPDVYDAVEPDATHAASSERAATMQRGRLAILNRVNDALRRTADKLAEAPALEAFLEQVLKSLVDTFQGTGGALWWGDDHTVTLSMELAHGVLTRTPADTHQDAASLKALLADSHDAARRIRAGLITLLDAQSIASSRAARDWIRSHAIKALLIVPLMLSERHFGCISVRLSETHTLGEEEVELAKALATQAALAMELTRLSNESRGVAIVQERARLAREVHDGIVQSFIGIKLQLNRLQAGEHHGALEKALELTRHGLAEARLAVRALRPLHLAGRTFVEAVTDMARNSVGEGVQVSVTSSGSWEGLAADAEGHFFRIIQEAVNNVVRHADASELAVEMSSSGSEISVLVSDNGKGFDVAAHQDADRGFGLFSMRQRADSMGAAFKIVSTRGSGTQVFTSLPRSMGGEMPV
jgi:signal transduction histidine kinase